MSNSGRGLAARGWPGPLVRIARLLNEQEIPAPRGGLWQVGSLSQLLKAPAFAGLLPETEVVWDEERGRHKYTGVVHPYLDPETGSSVVVGEGIVTVEEQRLIIAELESRTRLRGDGTKRPVRDPAHLLTGLLRCGVGGCGLRLPGPESSPGGPLAEERHQAKTGPPVCGRGASLGYQGSWPRASVRSRKAAPDRLGGRHR
ncbi:recombinase family protein [Streptomyces sp. NPDC002172]